MIELHGKSRKTYRVSFGVNTMADLEESFGLPIRAIVKRFRAKRPDPVVSQRFLRAVFVDYADVDEQELRRVLRDIGGMQVIRDAVKGLV